MILFHETFLFCGVIVTCYSKQTAIQIFGWVPPPIIWFICQTLVKYLNPIISVCVLNQFDGHWILFDALNSTIIMSSKTKEEINVRPSFEFLMDDDLGISFELTSLASNIRSKVFGVLDSFLSFMRTYDKKKAHNIGFDV